MLYTIAKTLVLPPTSLFVLLFLGLLLRRLWPRLGRAFLAALLLTTYLATTPFLAGELMAPLQTAAPVDLQHPDPNVDAILVLGAGIYFDAPEYQPPSAGDTGMDAADALSLQRLEYAAYLAKATGKPIMVTGGPAGQAGDQTLAEVMRSTLERDFGVAVKWAEDASDNTRSNATLSAAKLRAAGVDSIYLVTHAWHMPRALIAFEGTGIAIIPAPTRFVSQSELQWQDFVPSAKALLTSFYAVHEWLGTAWYRMQGQD